MKEYVVSFALWYSVSSEPRNSNFTFVYVSMYFWFCSFYVLISYISLLLLSSKSTKKVDSGCPVSLCMF